MHLRSRDWTRVICTCAVVGIAWLILFILLSRKSNNVRIRYLRTVHPDAQKGITTVMTLSCRKNVPNTTVIKRHFDSLIKVPSLLERVVLGFDGFKPEDDFNIHTKCRGSCDPSKYSAYVQEVVDMAHQYFHEVEFIMAPKRVCLTSNLKAAMEKVKTDFIYVCQEDLPIAKAFDIYALMDVISKNSEIDLIRVVHSSNAYHINWTDDHCRNKYNSPPVAEKKIYDGLTFTRCDQFSDQNHITYKDFYTHAIWPYVVEGDFMEHQLICAYGSHPHLYSTMWYLGDENDGFFIYDLDGRNFP